MISLDELDRLEKESTQGEWHFSDQPARVGGKLISGTNKISLLGDLCLEDGGITRNLEFIAALVNFWRSGGREMVRDYDWLLHNMRVLRASTDGARHYIDVPPANSLAEAIQAARRTSGDERG